MVRRQGTLYDGSYHDVDSSEMAFKICWLDLREGSVRRAKPVLLEPIMAVEVVVPEEYMGDGERRSEFAARPHRRHGDCAARRRSSSRACRFREMFGYATELRSRTQGRGSFTMHFGRYEEVPEALAEEIVSRVQGITK